VGHVLPNHGQAKRHIGHCIWLAGHFRVGVLAKSPLAIGFDPGLKQNSQKNDSQSGFNAAIIIDFPRYLRKKHH